MTPDDLAIARAQLAQAVAQLEHTRRLLEHVAGRLGEPIPAAPGGVYRGTAVEPIPARQSPGRPDPAFYGRLAFDSEVSDASPVIRGTWVTVAHIVSLIVDGWSWGDIIRAHPELTEDDIRAAIAYAVAEEEGEADR